MRRQGQYTDPGANPITQQQQPYPTQQFSADARYSVGYTEGQGKAASHNYIHEAQRLDPKHGTEKVGNNSALEGSHEDNASRPQTIDALEHRFLRDLTELVKEQHDAEDAELSRHRERLNEINAQYQKKLVAMRAQQEKIRDEFLRKESQSRYQQYQHTNSTARFQNGTLPSGAHHSYHLHYGAYGGDSGLRETYLAPASRYESGSHAHEFESRYPGSRGYSAGGRQH